jgi:outer membrane protein assembly factor BamA
MLLALLFPLAAPSRAERQAGARPQRLVETVEIVGNRRLTDEEIFSHLKTRPGKVYSERQVLRDLQALLRLRVFDTTQTRVSMKDGPKGGVVVIFVIVELPLLDDVKLTGLKGVAESDVLRALSERGIRLEKGAPFDPSQLYRAVEIVKQLLVERGLSGTSVKARLRNATPTSASVEFTFNEAKY